MKSKAFLRSRLAIATGASVLTFAVSAQPSPNQSTPASTIPQLDPIIVTASRIPTPLDQTLGDNSVIDRATLDLTPDATVAEVLGRQHGITFVNYGGPQTLTTINMRGTNSKQSLVLIDGMRVNSPTNGLPVLNAIPLNAVERIEIVRGAASSLYGADAIGGVVNIITRKGADTPFNAYATAGVGTYATSEYTAGFSGSKDGWQYSLNGGYGQSSGFNATNGQFMFANNPDKDSYYRSNVGGQLGYTWREGQTLNVQTLQSRVNSGYDSFDFLNDDRVIQTLNNTIITSNNQLSKRWQSQLSASFLTEKNETENAPLNGGTGYFKSRQNQYQWINTITLTDNQTMTVGYERLEQSVDAFSYGAPVDFTNDSVYTNAFMATYVGQWGRHQVQGSLRNDNNSQYGSFNTGSLAYAYDISANWRASVAANTAFRAPNFNELYYPGYANPNLSPERSKNIEAGLRYLHDEGEIELTAFYNRITDLIVSQSPTFIPQNVDTAVIKGISLSATQNIGRQTTVTAGLDLLSPYNTTTNERLPFNAQQVLRLGATHQVDAFGFNADWYLTSNRMDGKTTLGGYGLFNLGISYAVNDKLDVQLRWNNVFGKAYTLVQGYNTPGSNVFVNLSARY
jgi:vitamin B12 transporter